MIGLVVHDEDGKSERTFDNERVSIGSDPSCDLHVAGARARHVELLGNDDDGYRVVAYGGLFGGTKLNGTRLPKETATSIKSGDELAVAGTIIEFRVATPTQYTASDPAEAQLLAQITAGDDGARLVYGDWLEQRGDPKRAEFLRVQHAIITQPTTDFEQRVAQLRELAQTIDIAWRRQVARQFVEGCTGFEAPCPRVWSNMQPTERSDVRHCGGCKKNVYYCATIDQARRHAMRGHCVAVDAALVRTPHDLRPPMQVMAGAMPMPTAPPASGRR